MAVATQGSQLGPAVVSLQGPTLAQGVVPGQGFGLPGVTQWFSQVENLDGTATTLQQSSQVNVQFATQFKQTDIVFDWEMPVTITQNYAAGGGTFTLSPHFPYNWIGPISLNFQNQFNTINMPDGFCMAILQAIRPRYYGNLPTFLYQNPVSNAYNSQPNTMTASNYTTASTSVKFTLELLPALHFDAYYDLEADGLLYWAKQTPIKAWVSPQLMAGTNRVIAPVVNFNQALSTSAADVAPVTVSGGTPTFSGTGTLNFRRHGIYQPSGPFDTPPVFNWAYTRDYQRFGIGAQSQVSLAVPQRGQILCIALVLWDPALNGGIGGPIPIANINQINLVYGSGFYKYQDTPADMQRRLYNQHGIILPEGCLAWDMAMQQNGLISNRDALNTLITSSPTVQIMFNTTPGASAYCYMLLESLRYISIQ
jgi:hypothetical protein